METQIRKQNLPPLYCLYQAAYFFAIAGVGAFSVTYLMDKGLAAAQIGLIMACTNVLSCVLQPLIGSFVDRRSPAYLPRFILCFLLIAIGVFSAIELAHLPRLATGVLFAIGSLSFSITVPLGNSLCACYAQYGYAIDFGMGSGIGSLSFSFASLGFGYVIALLGTRSMMFVALLFIILQAVSILWFPRFGSEDKNRPSRANAKNSLSLYAFIRRYRFYMVMLVGVMGLAACHAMAENYMIHLFNRVGGGSEHVGIALFLACITNAPFMMFFERIQKKTGASILLRLSGFFYILKAGLMIFAPSILSIYLIELLQIFTYGFMYPSLYYLARQRIASADMAKGQAMNSTLYTLGTALGNSLGGVMIDLAGLNTMLALAGVIAAAGTLLIHIAVDKTDSAAGC
ncbi:MAG: MFS transporter [Clostridia bacterium]|nr:MFS transporter [Clostridia bacterium]